MRNYIPKDCVLPRWKYQAVLSLVRGYDDMIKAVKEAEYDVIYSGLSATFSEANSQGRRGASRPTENKVISLEKCNGEYWHIIRAIEHALTRFEQCDREVILNNIKHDKPLRYPWEIERNSTLQRRKKAFIYMVAENLGYA